MREGTGILLSPFLGGAGGLFALSVISTTLSGSSYGAVQVKWSSDQTVFWTELAIAAGAVLVTCLAIWRMVRGRGSRPVLWLGLGLLGVGLLSIAAGQTGFQVVAPVDALERGELMYVLLGIVGTIVGGLIAVFGADLTENQPD